MISLHETKVKVKNQVLVWLQLTRLSNQSVSGFFIPPKIPEEKENKVALIWIVDGFFALAVSTQRSQWEFDWGCWFLPQQHAFALLHPYTHTATHSHEHKHTQTLLKWEWENLSSEYKMHVCGKVREKVCVRESVSVCVRDVLKLGHVPRTFTLL